MAVSMLAWPVMMMTSVSGETLLDLLEHLDAGHAGHAQIEDGGVEGALFEGLDGRLAVGADGDLMPQAGQFGAHELLQRLSSSANRMRRLLCDAVLQDYSPPLRLAGSRITLHPQPQAVQCSFERTPFSETPFSDRRRLGRASSGSADA